MSEWVGTSCRGKESLPGPEGHLDKTLPHKDERGLMQDLNPLEERTAHSPACAV